VPAGFEVELRCGVLERVRATLRGSVDQRVGQWHLALVGDVEATFGDPLSDALPSLGDRHEMPGLRWGQGRGRAVGGVDLAWPVIG